MAHEGVTRRLAAIVAADIVGYSRLMSEDEAGTLLRLKAITDELLELKVREFGGRLVKTTGDGALLEFPSAVDAVLCAVTVQRDLAVREADLEQDKRIQYRVGINLGDIIYDGDDIYGDGVNVAARLEALAEPGGIRISDTVYRNVKGKLDLGFADLGPQKVKNIADPVPTYRVLLDPEDVGKFVAARPRFPFSMRDIAAALVVLVLAAGSFLLLGPEPAPPIPENPRLLVLPFEAENEAAELYADGATENLMASFGLIKAMTVVPRATAIQYKGMDPNVRKLSDEHGVHYVLSGKVIADGDRLNVGLLQTAANGKKTWADTIEGSASDAFQLFAKLKTKAIASMDIPLNEKERQLLEAEPTRSMEAYLEYEAGERARNTGHWRDLGTAIEKFDKALSKDPEFVDAKIGYARANYWIWLWTWDQLRYAPDALEASVETVEEVLSEDRKNPDALELRTILYLERLNYDRALISVRTAVTDYPNEPQIRFAMARVLAALGEYEKAIDYLDTFVEMSPRLRSRRIWQVAVEYGRMGEHEKALSLLAQVEGKAADQLAQTIYLAEMNARAGNLELANGFIKTVLEIWPGISNAWLEPQLRTYKNPDYFKDYARTMRSLGVPDWPYDLDNKLADDQLSAEDLQEIATRRPYRSVDAVGAFGEAFEFAVDKSGIRTGINGLNPNISYRGKQTVRGDEKCLLDPAIFMGREFCFHTFFDRKNSTDEQTRYIDLYPWGVAKYGIEFLEAQ